jgi:hypothetical protein
MIFAFTPFIIKFWAWQEQRDGLWLGTSFVGNFVSPLQTSPAAHSESRF